MRRCSAWRSPSIRRRRAATTESSDRGRPTDADEYADDGQTKTTTPYHPQYVPARRSQRHSNANLLGALADCVGDYAVWGFTCRLTNMEAR